MAKSKATKPTPEQQVKDLTRERDRIQAELTATQQELGETRGKAAQVEEARISALEAVRRAEERKTSLAGELLEARTAQGELDTECVKLRQEKQADAASIAALDNTIAELRKSLASAQAGTDRAINERDSARKLKWLLIALLLGALAIVAMSSAHGQATASYAWDDPHLSLHVPQEVLQLFRNPDGCLSPESPIDTDHGPVRIDSLNPNKHAIKFHAADGSIKFTTNYLSFPTTVPARVLFRLGKARVTGNHLVAVGDWPEYQWAEAKELGLPREELDTPITVWDISIGEPCYKNQANFFTDGKLVHNSCVQCSNGMTGTDQNVPEFAYLLWDSEYGKKVRGGSSPSRVANYAKARNVRIYNVTGRTTWDWMRWACANGRGVAIGAGGNHFQTLVGYDPPTKRWFVVNNNGDQRIQEYSDEAFRRLHLASGQWCVVLDYPPAPAPPKYLAWWRDDVYPNPPPQDIAGQ